MSKISHRISTVVKLDNRTSVTATGIAYMHEDDHVDENPVHDTAVQADLDGVYYGDKDILPVLKMTAEDFVDELKDALLKAGWQHFRTKQESEQKEFVYEHEQD